MSHWIACFQDVTASSSWSVLTVLNCGQITSFYFEHLRQKQLQLKRFCTYQPTQTTLFISSRSSLKCRPWWLFKFIDNKNRALNDADFFFFLILTSQELFNLFATNIIEKYQQIRNSLLFVQSCLPLSFHQ